MQHGCTLIIAGVTDMPVEITSGLKIDQHNLRSTHEEADILITQHVILSSLLGKSVSIVCDNTDVFVLLVHYYNSRCKGSNVAPVIMPSPEKERAVVDIHATAEEQGDIAGDLLALHGSSGADTVSSLHGIGKAIIVKTAKKGGCPLFDIGNVQAEMKSVEDQVPSFICAAYGKAAESFKSMTECRVKMWHSKTGKSGISSAKLCSLPPNTDAFIGNVHRCHLQVTIWKAALLESPPEMGSVKYGWEGDHQSILLPQTIPSGTPSAPPYVLQLIRCNCKTSGCQTAACSCLKLGCTIFCLCEGIEACKNPLTKLFGRRF